MPAIRTVRVIETRMKEVQVASTDEFDLPTDAIQKAHETDLGDWTLLAITAEVDR